ncbi:unnamed protein product [Closterium sp. NIES-65]|nr:unnamed protein product [Closterium sp. NIES-65]
MRLFQRRNVFGSPPTFPPPHLPLSRPPRPSHPSPPGYYFRAGTGAGKSMWHIYLPHGGWCRNANECVGRSKTALGSSTFYPDDPTNATLSPNFDGILSTAGSNRSINPPVLLSSCSRLQLPSTHRPSSPIWTAFLAATAASTRPPFRLFFSSTPRSHSRLQTIPSPGFNGILSSNSSINPPFYNWNLVRLIYCDGGGYSGTAGRLEINNDTAINLDGWNIVQAVIEGAL